MAELVANRQAEAAVVCANQVDVLRVGTGELELAALAGIRGFVVHQVALLACEDLQTDKGDRTGQLGCFEAEQSELISANLIARVYLMLPFNVGGMQISRRRQIWRLGQ